MWDLLKGLVWSLLYWALVCAVAVLAFAIVVDLIASIFKVLREWLAAHFPTLIDLFQQFATYMENVISLDTLDHRKRVAKKLDSCAEKIKVMGEDSESLKELKRAAESLYSFKRSYALDALGRLGERVPEGFELQLLMSSVSDDSDIPTTGKNLVIVAGVGDGLRFRIFGVDGNVVVESAEMSLTSRAGQIADLKKQLENLWPPHQLTEGEKVRVVTAVASIFGLSVLESVMDIQIKGLASHDPFVREAAAHALYRMGNQAVSAREALIGVLRRRRSEGTARYAVLALGQIRKLLKPDDLEVLEKVLEDAALARNSYAATEAGDLLRALREASPRSAQAGGL